jgi:hypothetical protein
MTRYAGRYVCTIQPQDIGKAWLSLDGRTVMVADFLGCVMVRDIGKQVWEHRGVFSVENEEQCAARMGSSPSPSRVADARGQS